jgi:hypothetical protein
MLCWADPVSDAICVVLGVTRFAIGTESLGISTLFAATQRSHAAPTSGRGHRRAASVPPSSSAAVKYKTIVDGSGTAAAAEIVTVPGVLVKGTADVSVPVLKLKLSKKVPMLPSIEPLPLGGTRLTE